MRPPRFRFSEEVRSTTRSIAARMVREGTVAGSPAELDAWTAGRPEVREPLERGGYGTEFTAEDLFPLLEVFVVQAGGAARAPDVPAGAPRRPWMWAAAAGVGILLVLAALASGALSR